MRIIFLDIDGVVLHGEALWSTQDSRHLPPEKIALVKQACDRAGAIIVVSSTWRYFDETEDRLQMLGLPVHRDWRTRDSRGSECRGHDIAEWLFAHPETESYAIVDDDSDMLPEQMPRFVKTPFVTGIEQEHVDRLVEILRTPPI